MPDILYADLFQEARGKVEQLKWQYATAFREV